MAIFQIKAVEFIIKLILILIAIIYGVKQVQRIPGELNDKGIGGIVDEIVKLVICFGIVAFVYSQPITMWMPIIFSVLNKIVALLKDIINVILGI